MLVPLMQLFDVFVLDGGDLALGGTDEFLRDGQELDAALLQGAPLVLFLRGGRRVETEVRDLKAATALTGQRNLFVRATIPDLDAAAAMRAIAMVPEEALARSRGA